MRVKYHAFHRCLAILQFDQHLGRRFAHLFMWYVNRRQLRARYLRKFDIIKSHDRDIAWHGKPHIKRLGYSTNSQYVIAANDCSRFANSPKQRLKSLGTAF